MKLDSLHSNSKWGWASRGEEPPPERPKKKRRYKKPVPEKQTPAEFLASNKTQPIDVGDELIKKQRGKKKEKSKSRPFFPPDAQSFLPLDGQF